MSTARKRILSLALAVCLLLAMTLVAPGPVTVSAAVEMQEGKPTITRNSTVVAFGGHEWVVIGYNGSGVHLNGGTNAATLLLKNGDVGGGFDPVPFREGHNSDPGGDFTLHSDTYWYANNPSGTAWNAPNEYRGSTLQREMESIAGGFPAKERTLMKERTLTANDDSTYKITGGDVENQPLWPLSYDEWNTVYNNGSGKDMLAYGDGTSNHWWLRSPYSDSILDFLAFVGSASGSDRVHGDVDDPWAVRPAFQLNLESVIFTSDASGKSQAGVGDGLVVATAPSGTDTIKFTMPDTMTLTGVDTSPITKKQGETFDISYTSASTGSNNYISCVLVLGNEVKYYGKLETANGGGGTPTVELPNDIPTGDYTLRVFVEEANGSLYTDFASTPVNIDLKVEAGDFDPPTVDTVSPSGAGIPIDTDTLSITFNEDMDTTVTGAVALDNGAGVTGGIWDDDRTITYTLSGLAYGETYTYSINGFKDLAGNEMAAVTSGFDFTTVNDPQSGLHSIVVTATPPAGGVPEATPTNAASGTQITLDAAPASGYTFDRWESSDGITFASQTQLSTTFTMPDNDVTITAHYTWDGVTPPSGTVPTIITDSLPDGKVGEPYSETLTATGDAPINWTVSGNLPLGLSLSGNEISGTPEQAGIFGFTVKAENAHGEDTKALSIKITPDEGGGTDPTDPTDPTNPTTPGGNGGGSSGSRSTSRDRSSGRSSPDRQVAKTTLPASAFSWDGRTLTINHDSISVLGLLSVQWDGKTLTRGTDYGVYQGSVIVRFGEGFIATQSPGDHTIKVEFLNHTGETTVTVGDTGLTTEEPNDDLFDNNTHNPNTGGYPDGSYPATDNPNTGLDASLWNLLNYDPRLGWLRWMMIAVAVCSAGLLVWTLIPHRVEGTAPATDDME